MACSGRNRPDRVFNVVAHIGTYALSGPVRRVGHMWAVRSCRFRVFPVDRVAGTLCGGSFEG
jgi:hypothetical protein